MRPKIHRIHPQFYAVNAKTGITAETQTYLRARNLLTLDPTNPRAEQWRATVAMLEHQFDMGTDAAGVVMP
jgi:hypothetical protein